MFDVRHLAWIAVGGSVLAWFLTAPARERVPSPSEPKVSKPFPLEVREPKPLRLELSGKFVAEPSSIVTVELPLGAVLDKSMAKVGSHVNKGQTLAMASLNLTKGRRVITGLNSTSEAAYAEQLSNALGSAVDQHESSVTRARSEFETAQRDYDSTIEKAKAERDRLLNASTVNVRELEKAVSESQTTRDKAKALSDRDARALNEGWISRNQATASRQAYEKAEEELRGAEHRLAEAKRGPSDPEAARIQQEFEKTQLVAEKKLEEARGQLQAAENGGLAFPGGAPATFGRINHVPIRGGFLRQIALRTPVAGTLTAVANRAFSIFKDNGKVLFLARVKPEVADRLLPGATVQLGSETAMIKAVGPSDLATREVYVRVATRQQPKLGTVARAVIEIQP